MAVPKNKRSLADTEYFHNGMQMRNIILDLLIRDFGVKINKNSFEVLQKMHNISEEDMELIEFICKKYRVAEHILYEFPGWFMEYERKYLMDSLRRFLMHLRYADAIVVKSNDLHEYRRYHIVQARTECLMIMDEMEYIAKVYPVNMKKFLPLIDCIHYEIKLLNRLEKSDNDKWRKWKKKQDDKKEPQHVPTPEISEPGSGREPDHILNPFDDDLKRTPFDIDNKEMIRKPVKMIKKSA